MPTQLVDDPLGIPDSVILYRRTTWGKIGGKPVGPGVLSHEITKNFFTDAPPAVAEQYGLARVCMSVGTSIYLANDPTPMLARFAGCGLVAFSAGDVRSLTTSQGPAPQGVMLFPTPDEPWHAVVFDLVAQKRSTAACKSLANLARVVVPLVS